jgi:hypothetical protein
MATWGHELTRPVFSPMQDSARADLRLSSR